MHLILIGNVHSMQINVGAFSYLIILRKARHSNLCRK